MFALAKLATCVLTLTVGGSLRIAQQREKGEIHSFDVELRSCMFRISDTYISMMWYHAV